MNSRFSKEAARYFGRAAVYLVVMPLVLGIIQIVWVAHEDPSNLRTLMLLLIPFGIITWYVIGFASALATGLVMGLVCLYTRSFSEWLVTSILVGGTAGGWLLHLHQRTQFDWQAAGICAACAFAATLLLKRFASLRPDAE